MPQASSAHTTTGSQPLGIFTAGRLLTVFLLMHTQGCHTPSRTQALHLQPSRRHARQPRHDTGQQPTRNHGVSPAYETHSAQAAHRLPAS